MSVASCLESPLGDIVIDQVMSRNVGMHVNIHSRRERDPSNPKWCLHRPLNWLAAHSHCMVSSGLYGEAIWRILWHILGCARTMLTRNRDIWL